MKTSAASRTFLPTAPTMPPSAPTTTIWPRCTATSRAASSTRWAAAWSTTRSSARRPRPAPGSPIMRCVRATASSAARASCSTYGDAVREPALTDQFGSLYQFSCSNGYQSTVAAAAHRPAGSARRAHLRGRRGAELSSASDSSSAPATSTTSSASEIEYVGGTLLPNLIPDLTAAPEAAAGVRARLLLHRRLRPEREHAGLPRPGRRIHRRERHRHATSSCAAATPISTRWCSAPSTATMRR